jgi:hypothetical protein
VFIHDAVAAVGRAGHTTDHGGDGGRDDTAPQMVVRFTVLLSRRWRPVGPAARSMTISAR